jgi:hypothetical protein
VAGRGLKEALWVLKIESGGWKRAKGGPVGFKIEPGGWKRAEGGCGFQNTVESGGWKRAEGGCIQEGCGNHNQNVA